MIPYSGLLPLRTTAVWAGYREAQVIPHRYGETGGACLQYNSANTQFVWADHPSESIDDVLIDGQSVTNYQWHNVADNTDRVVTMVEFDGPLEQGVTVVARGRGKQSALTGRLITSPADVVRDILVMADRGVTAARLDPFRSACERAGLIVGGSIADETTVQSAIRSVCESVGAIFAPDARELCHLWPADGGSVRGTVEQKHPLSADMSLDDLATVLVVSYAHEDGTPRAAVEIEAREPSVIHGRRVVNRDCPWIRSARVAVAVATRLLQHYARPVWNVSADGLAGDVRVGDGLTLIHPLLPITGTYTVLERTLAPEAAVSSVTLAVPVGTPPLVRLIRQSSMIEPEQYASAGLQRQGAEYVLTVNDENGRPIAFASVTLDGQMTRLTNAAGKVNFPASAMAPGEHTFDVKTLDGRTLTMTQVV